MEAPLAPQVPSYIVSLKHVLTVAHTNDEEHTNEL